MGGWLITELKSLLLKSAGVFVVLIIAFYIFLRDSINLSLNMLPVIFLCCLLMVFLSRGGLAQKISDKLFEKALSQKSLSKKRNSKLAADTEWDLPHPDQLVDVSWSPKGDLLATSCGDHIVRIFEVNGGITQVTSISHDPGSVYTNIAWSPDAKEIALAEEMVSIWDVESGNRVHQFEHKDMFPDYANKLIAPSTVAYSPDGRMLASSFHDGSNSKDYPAPILMWDLRTSEVRLTLMGHQGGFNRLAWSPDNQLLASSGMDRTIRVWDPITGEELAKYLLEVVELSDLTWSQSRNRIAIRSWNDAVYIWQVGEGQDSGQSLQVGHKVSCVTWSPNDGSIACGCFNGAIRIMDLAKGTEVKKLDRHQGRVSAISWSSDGRFLASGGEDRKVRIWRASSI